MFRERVKIKCIVYYKYVDAKITVNKKINAINKETFILIGGNALGNILIRIFCIVCFSSTSG